MLDDQSTPKYIVCSLFSYQFTFVIFLIIIFNICLYDSTLAHPYKRFLLVYVK